MNTRNLYLLVPCNYSRPVKDQILVDRIKIHVGRGKSLEAAQEALERELNNGKTLADVMAMPLSEGKIAAHKAHVHVIYDTWKSWLDYTQSKQWPVMAEIEAMLE